MKEGEHDDRTKEIFKFLGYLLRDSNKTTMMEEEEVPQLPEDIAKNCPPDDIYLMELALFSNDRTIITTDRKLKEKMSPFPILKVLIFSDFIQIYDC
jgi:predicted nucleic acid-binding protein